MKLSEIKPPLKLVPTWEAVLPMLIEGLSCETEDGRRIAREELQRMARLADEYARANEGAPS